MKYVQLLWTADAESHKFTAETYFMLGAGIGLTDVDMHKLTAAGWQHMRASGENGVASLTVAPQSDMQSLQDAIDQIATKGGYKTIMITVRQL